MLHRLLRSGRFRVLSILATAVVAASVGGVVVAYAADTTTGISGHFTEDGAPVAYASVDLVDTDYNYIDFTSTGSDGEFSFVDLAPGEYKVGFWADGLEQWYSQQRSFWDGDVITVTAGEVTVVEEAVRPLGSIAGRVTNADATPAAYAEISAYPVDGNGNGGFANADADGDYTLPRLDPGYYIVSFQRDWGSPTQYANNATSWEAATPIQVSAGAVTPLDQTLLPTGTVSGVVTDDGVPVADVQVGVYEVDGPAYAYSYTDSQGFYSVSTTPGIYTVEFDWADGLSQYAPGQLDYATAGQYQVTAGGVTSVDEELLDTGFISGRVTTADGEPVAWTSVTAYGDSTMAYSYADEEGYYQLAAFAGSYALEFDTPYGPQWAHGRSSATSADMITVVADSTATVDETLAPFGSVEITAVEAGHKGAPLATFCASVQYFWDCTDSGMLTVEQLLPGPYVVSAQPEGDGTFLGQTVTALVQSNTVTRVEVPLESGGEVTTVITDAVTGAPVGNACVELVNVDKPYTLGNGYPESNCSDETGAVRIRQVAPGDYKAFVWAPDESYGHQWVGNKGGVGKFKKAVTISVKSGRTAELNPVKLDGAGSISGTVIDEVTGKPATSGTVGIAPFTRAGPSGTVVGIDSSGRYTFGGLGPYAWSLLFQPFGYAAEWSGGTPDRDKAAGIVVRTGETTVYDEQVGAGTVVTGEVFGPAGARLSGAALTFFDARTGEVVGDVDVWSGQPRYTAHLLGKRRVKVQYWAYVRGQTYQGWVGGDSFDSASGVKIPAGGELTLDVTVTQVIR